MRCAVPPSRTHAQAQLISRFASSLLPPRLLHLRSHRIASNKKIQGPPELDPGRNGLWIAHRWVRCGGGWWGLSYSPSSALASPTIHPSLPKKKMPTPSSSSSSQPRVGQLAHLSSAHWPGGGAPWPTAVHARQRPEIVVSLCLCRLRVWHALTSITCFGRVL